MTYVAADWYWIVGGDLSRAYSSALGDYVTSWPSDKVTHIASELELNEVLGAYGLRGPLVTKDYVRSEAQRRIVAVMGARDFTDCLIKQLNANMRANELNDKQINGSLTPEEQLEAENLRAMALKIKEIRDASNVLEESRPSNYADDEHWPA